MGVSWVWDPVFPIPQNKIVYEKGGNMRRPSMKDIITNGNGSASSMKTKRRKDIERSLVSIGIPPSEVNIASSIGPGSTRQS